MYRERDGLEPVIYTNISWMHEDYRKMLSVEHNQRLLTYLYMCIYCLSLLDRVSVDSQPLKPAVAEGLIELLALIQQAYQASTEWQEADI